MKLSPKPFLSLLLIILALAAGACQGPDQPLTTEPIPAAIASPDLATEEVALPPTLSPTAPPDTPTPIPEGTPVLVALQPVQVLSGPGPVFEALHTLPAGQVTIIQGRSADGHWWVVSGSGDSFGSQGWVSGQGVVVGGDTSALPVVEPPAAPTATTEALVEAAVTEPAEETQAEPPAATEPPAPTPMLWPPVVSGPYLLAQQPAEVRTGPGEAYPVLAVLPSGQEVPLLGRSTDGRWWAVPGPGDGSGPQGWVVITAVTAYEGETSVPVLDAPVEPPGPPPAEQQPTAEPVVISPTPIPPTPTPVPGTPTPVPVIVNPGAPTADACIVQHPGGEGVVNVYLGPHENFPLIAWLVNWAPVLETREGWYQVQTNPGEVGWVAAGTVSLVGPCE